jgi:hypothetical protein
MGSLLLNAGPQPVPDHRDRIIASLQQENSDLREQLSDAVAEVSRVRAARAAGVAELQQILLPLHHAMQLVFGQIDAVLPNGVQPTINGSNKWDAIKLRLAPRLREAVDILQMQGSMKRTQLAAALKMDYSNCTKNVVSVLLRQGWLVDNGGDLSLKPL